MKSLRITALIMATLMLLPFCACDNGGGADTPETTTQTETTPMIPETTEQVYDETTTAPETTAEEEIKLPAYKVLFIGNSFTYYNEMYNMFVQMVKSVGGKVNMLAIYKGGYYLTQFLDTTDDKGAAVAAAIKGKYDYVFLQEQSQRPITAPGVFYDSVRDFKKLLEPYGSKIILYQTWGYKKGHSTLASNNWTTASMEMKLRQNYTAIGEELGLPVSYAGAAMQYVYDNYPKIDLYNADLKHPSPAGSYLIACMLFNTLYGVSPEKITYNADLTPANAEILRKSAALVVANDPTKGMTKVSSVGVGNNKTVTDYGIDTSKTVNLSKMPSSKMISVVKDNGKVSGLVGDNGKVCSTANGTKLTDAQIADLADIKYGVSLIGAITMPKTSKNGVVFSGIEALVNGAWASTYMATWTFGTTGYTIAGTPEADAKYCGLITLNFGEVRKFDAIGYYSGSLGGFPQVQDVYVSDDGVTWTRVESACYDAIGMYKSGNKRLIDLGKSEADPYSGSTATVRCLFSMNGATGKYIRIGIIKGRAETNDPAAWENRTDQQINTRELVVFGE